VDTRTERQIQRALETLLQGRTSFVIAHRLSTIQHADQVLVVEGGQIVERGTHQELLDRGGAYYRLYSRQFLRAEGDDAAAPAAGAPSRSAAAAPSNGAVALSTPPTPHAGSGRDGAAHGSSPAGPT
jgi:ATP-binding cassette subfamily B protein